MSYYREHQETAERAKAIAAVLVVHAGLAAIILSGLDVRVVAREVERMTTIAVSEPPPPPPEPPPPAQVADRKKLEEGAAGKRAEPTPVVAPKPRLPVESPVPAAPVAGQGSAAFAGAADSGTGTGAGGSGSGRGGGGSGDYSGFTPARLVRNLSHSDYRGLAAGRLPSGRAMVSLTVDTRGLPTGCRLASSSGDSVVDSGLCPLITRRLRFRPALDAQRRPIPYSLQYVANWSL